MEHFGAILEAVGPFAAYITDAATFAFILTALFNAQRPYRHPATPLVLVFLLAGVIIGVTSQAVGAEMTYQAYFQLILATLVAGLQAVLTHQAAKRQFEAISEHRYREYVEENGAEIVLTPDQQLTPAASDDPRSRYLSSGEPVDPEDDDEEETERRIGFRND